MSECLSALSAHGFAISRHSEHTEREEFINSLLLRTPYFLFITFIIFYIGLSPTFLFEATLPARRKEETHCSAPRRPASQFKTPLSSAARANESGQPLNKNCHFLFRFIGECKDLAGRPGCLRRTSSHSFRPRHGCRLCVAMQTHCSF